ncbi:uncharacterized protein [Mycetomoellerius zeteki]|uniref:uncharacterized protein n=1 Tax=Mycetomoellerius zeteki TaxID=64791 RepID=UPI00084EA4E8|nr:PREDICTED: uncharacterized protein LOC108721306 [Trachymyrmex zeteki]
MIIRSTVSPILKIGFQLFGIWPGVSYSTIRSMSIISSILIIQYFQYLYIFNHFKISEISNLNDSLNLTFTYGLTVFKLIYLWIRRQVFRQILVAMDNDWRECINMDKHLYIMTIKANLAHFISNSILSVSTIIAIPFFLGEYVIHSIFSTEDQNITLRPLPMKIQLPFDTQQSPMFEIVFTILFLHSIIIFSKSIVNAAYELPWYDLPSHQSKMLMLIIIRSQKQLTISAGKIMDMSFETYTNISEFPNLIDGLSLTLDYSLTFVKLASLWIHRRVLHKIFAAMDNDWSECINIDENLNMMMIKASVSHFYSNAMLSFNGVAAVLYVLGDYAIRFVYSAKNYNDTLRQLPIKVLLPFETEQSPIFELLVAILFLHIILVSFVVAVLNGLIFTLVLHVSGQIDIICQGFKNISENAFPRSSAFTLGMLIKRHNKVYAFSENIEEFFSFIALMQVVCKTVVICCLGFVIIISVHNEIDFFVFVKATVAYIAVMIEIFIICFAGEYLSLKSKSVADAAYKSLWYDMPINQTKIISFVIMKSQRRLSITAGKMMDMSFEALTSNTQTDNTSYFELLLDYTARNWDRLIDTPADDVRTIIVSPLTRKRRRSPIPYKIMRATTISTSVEIGLRFVGIWPGLPYGTITWFAYMISLVFALYFQYVYVFDHFDVNNISNLVDALSITLAYSLSFLKLFYDIVLAMEEDWNNVNIYDKSVLCIMASNANLSRRCSNVLISINATAAICYSVTNFLRLSTDFKEDLNISSRVLPVKMKFPFKVDVSPLFELLAVGQILHVVSIATLVAMMNCLIITLVLHVSGQIDILRRELLTIYDNGISQRDVVTSVRLLIIRHQKIITLSDNIEELYSDIALMQFLSNTVVICCIGFTIIASLVRDGATVVILKSAVFYVAVTLEAFIFCFAGEYLSAKSKSIGDAVYEALWYNMTPAECRILLFVILRSQKRLTITAGNVMDLSLEGFTSVMKASASYVSVLYAIAPKMNSKTDSLKILDGTVSRSIEIGLRVIGVWPNSSFTILRRAFWMITLTMAQTFQYRYFVIHVRTDDLSHLMDGLSTTMSYSLLLLKLTIFWINRRIFHDILTMMSQDRSECMTEWAIYSMSRTTDVSHRFSNLIIGLYSTSVFIYGTGVLVAHPDESDEQLTVPARELFLKMELPFESSASPAYELVMITQFFHQLSAATIVGVLNALIVSLGRMIGNAAYETKWYNLNPTQSRILLLMILRSQRNLTITIGKFMELSLERFTTNEIDSTNIVCWSVQYGLRMIGVWPGMSCAILFKILSISSMIVFQILQYQYVIVHFEEEDLMILMDALSVTFAYTLLLIKMLIFAFNSRLLNEIITSMIKDWKECDVSDEYTMSRIAYISRWVSNVIICSHMTSVFLYAIGTIMKIKNENQTDVRELIIKMEIPFKIESTSVHIAVLVTQFIHQTSAAGMVGVVNSLLIILVFHVCGQIDIMRQKLSEITQKNVERKNIEQNVNENVLKDLIVRHQEIITFSKNIEDLYSNIALVQFVSNTLVICCLGFLIVISIGAPGGSMMLVKSVFFYIVMSLEAFVYCFVGQYLSTKSEMVGDSAYESFWYELSPSQNRDIHIMIIRSQQHLTLTIGKVMELSLRQFANTFQYWYLIMHFGKSNIFLLMDVISATLTYSLLLVKLIIIIFNVRLLDDIIAHVVEDWKKRDVSDEYTMNRMAYISRWFSNLIICSHAVSVFFYAIGTLLAHKNSNQTDARELILKMELPFEIETTSVYLTVLITQFVHQVSAASMLAVLNCLLLTLVLHACGQIDILRQKLSEITRKNTKQHMNDIAKILIIRHQKIISFSKNIETLFSNIALIQFVSITLVLCSLGFVIVTSIGVPGGSPMLVKSVFFYILVNMEAFIVCFLGEYLSTKSKMIGDAAYEALWYELNPIQHRDILFIIVRSQKYLTLTIGKVAELSLKQFTNIMKASASYMSVLHAIY